MASINFEDLVNTHYAALYRFGLSLARNEAHACDLTQQTFYLWATRGHQLRDRSKVKSWLFTTLYREFLGSRRHETSFPKVEFDSVAQDIPSTAPRTTNAADGAAVVDALAEIDEVYRVPLTLFYLEELSYKEIAAALDIPIGTVMSRLSRGKEQLRKRFDVNPQSRIVPFKPNEAAGNE